jgi:hypothetical protein
VAPVVSNDDLVRAGAVLRDESARCAQEIRTCPIDKRNAWQNRTTEVLHIGQYIALVMACYCDLCFCAELSLFVSAVNAFGAVENDEIKKEEKWNLVRETRRRAVRAHLELIRGTSHRDDATDEQMRQIRQMNDDVDRIDAEIAVIDAEIAVIEAETSTKVDALNAEFKRAVVGSSQCKAAADAAEDKARVAKAEAAMALSSSKIAKAKVIADAKAKAESAKQACAAEPPCWSGHDTRSKFIFFRFLNPVKNFFIAIFKWFFCVERAAS